MRVTRLRVRLSMRLATIFPNVSINLPLGIIFSPLKSYVLGFQKSGFLGKWEYEQVL